MSARPALVYLLWAPLGAERVEAFISAYKQFDPGIDHELIVAACDGADGSALPPLLELFAGIDHTVEQFDGPRIDLQTYRELIARRPDTEEFVFANSYARPLADGWLRIMAGALRRPEVGMIGPGGSYESAVRSLRFHLALIYWRNFTRFPNPHIRTSCFGINRRALGAIDWPQVRSKLDAYKLESGRRSLARQVEAAGLKAVVVGRDGGVFESGDWRASNTFRAGGQKNLLVADLRTDDYEAADPALRAKLEDMAWGSPEA